MKRCSAIAAWRAVKELRRAQKGAGTFDQLLQFHVDGLENLLLFVNHGEHSDLLDMRALKDIERDLAAREDEKGGIVGRETRTPERPTSAQAPVEALGSAPRYELAEDSTDA